MRSFIGESKIPEEKPFTDLSPGTLPVMAPVATHESLVETYLLISR